MAKLDAQTIFLGSAVLGALFVAGYVVISQENNGHASGTRTSELALDDIPFDGDGAYKMLKKLCDLGPRPSGSPAMAKQQRLLTDHFQQLGGEVRMQRFVVRHPVDGTPVKMANLVVQWHGDRMERILLCAHYDTRPYPDRDSNPANRRGIFVGANDGASGVAVLAELARHLPDLPGPLGVDMVLLDGEEFVFDDDRDEYFLGSEYFARDYAVSPPAHRYRWGVLLDMVGDARLQLYQERHGLRWKDTRPLVREIWETARRLGVKEFRARPGFEIRDDHIKLHDIGGIPTCDIIDFEYPTYPKANQSTYWHTTQDTPDKCSALSLAKVGWVVHEWLKSLE